MREEKDIGQQIVTYLEGAENETLSDPALAHWLAESETNQKEFDRYKRIWKESQNYMELEVFDVDLAWKKTNEINQRKKVIRKRLTNLCYTLSGVAASILLFITLSVVGVFEKESESVVRMATNNGSRSEIVLPDGSTVKLNAGSEICYSYNKEKQVREVRFQGEGFFDIAKSNIPLVVTMPNGLQVKVLGTSFNLSAYAEDPTVRASLVEGSIELNHSTGQLILRPGEMAVYDKKTTDLKLQSGILSHTYGWLDNKLYMDNMSLSEVCKYMERWYDVSVSVPREIGVKIHYSGVLKEESIMDVMEALSNLSAISYQVKGRNISITTSK